MYLTVITFKNEVKQVVIRLNEKVTEDNLVLGKVNKLIDGKTGAILVFNSDDVMYISQVKE